jgi:hypothetical protein
MTTAPIARFIYGTRTLDINDNVRYALETGFAPPPALLSAQMSDGTSANRTGGATKIGQRAQNRQWSFSVQCLGGSEREVSRAFQDLASFMMYAGIDKANPLYFEYKPNSDINIKPSWGQDGWLRYEVRHAAPPQIGERYSSGEFRARNVTALLSIEVAPYAEGLQQRLCSASGGIIEDTIGTADGISRGLIVPEATCNLFTNPVFGHATWNTGWSAGASILALQNTDPTFLLPGTQNSVRLTASASVTNTYTQDLTLSASPNAIWSAVKLPDGGAVTASNLQMCYNGSVLDTQYTNAGNGIWYAVASALGTASAASTGVSVKNGQTVYLMAAQAERKDRRTPLCWGDLLGCSWSGSAHASTSLRAAGTVKITTAADTVQTVPLSIQLAFKTPTMPATAYSPLLFDFRDASHTDAPYCYLENRLIFTYKNYGLFSGTLASDTVYLVHCVVSGNGDAALYVNGALVDSAAAIGHAALGTQMFVGSTYLGAQQTNFTLYDFTVWNVALTAAQIASEAANLVPVLADDKRLSPVPWLWTKDGDNVVDNCDDSTRDNFTVIGGLAGTNPAKSVCDFRTGNANTQIYIGRYAAQEFLTPVNRVYYDMDTTATTSADSGSAVSSGTITTSPNVISGAAGPVYDEALADNQIILLARMKDAGSALLAQVYFELANVAINSDFLPVTSVSTYRIIEIGTLVLPKNEIADTPWTPIGLNPRFKRSTGSGDVTLDYFIALPNAMKIIPTSGYQYLYSDGRCFSYAAASGKINERSVMSGARLDLYPDMINVVIHMLGFLAAACAVTDTLTYNSVKITPRWGLI